jgi:hypothetical protein
MYSVCLAEPMKDVEAMTCYLTPSERRRVESIADREERPVSKIVQFAVRAFERLYEENPDKALELAQPK